MPTITGAGGIVDVKDNATLNPFATLTVTDPDTQEMLASVSILNGVHRGDFVNAMESGWTGRQIVGNDIVYQRYFNPAADIGSAAQAAIRALVFQPRNDAITPGTTELTDFQITISDGVAPAIRNSMTRVTTTSFNDVPAIIVAEVSQAVFAGAPVAPFRTLEVTDSDTQDMLARIDVTDGMNQGDFTPESTVGWMRRVNGMDIVSIRYFSPSSRIGSIVQAAVWTLLFQTRANNPSGQTALCVFSVELRDGAGAAVTSHELSVLAIGK